MLWWELLSDDFSVYYFTFNHMSSHRDAFDARCCIISLFEIALNLLNEDKRKNMIEMIIHVHFCFKVYTTATYSYNMKCISNYDSSWLSKRAALYIYIYACMYISMLRYSFCNIKKQILKVTNNAKVGRFNIMHIGFCQNHKIPNVPQ